MLSVGADGGARRWRAHARAGPRSGRRGRLTRRAATCPSRQRAGNGASNQRGGARVAGLRRSPRGPRATSGPGLHRSPRGPCATSGPACAGVRADRAPPAAPPARKSARTVRHQRPRLRGSPRDRAPPAAPPARKSAGPRATGRPASARVGEAALEWGGPPVTAALEGAGPCANGRCDQGGGPAESRMSAQTAVVAETAKASNAVGGLDVPVAERFRSGNADRGPSHGSPIRKGCSGGVLLSHTLSSAVPSALAGLASGFGMGPGVSPPL